MRIVRDKRLDDYTGQVVFESPLLNDYGTPYGWFYSMKDHTGAETVLIQKAEEHHPLCTCDICSGLSNVWDQIVLDNNMIPNPSTGRRW